MAVTTSITDNGSYHTIGLTGSGTITLDEVYNDLYTLAGDAETYMTKTGSNPYVYTGKLQSGENYIRIDCNSGVTFHMDNEGDTLGMEYHATSSSTYTVMIIDSGAKMIMEAGCIVDHDINSSTHHRAYWTINGALEVNGTSSKRCKINEPRSMYFNMDDTSQSNDINYLDVVTGTYNNSYTLYFFPNGYRDNGSTHSYQNIRILGTNNANDGYPYWLDGNYEGCTFKGIECDDIREVGFRGCYNLLLEDCTFKQVYSLINPQGAGQGGVLHANYNVNSDRAGNRYYGKARSNSQGFLWFKNCTWEDCYNSSGSEHQMYLQDGSMVVFEDCTFQGVEDASHTGVEVVHDCKAFYVGTTTFTNVTNHRVWGSTAGTHLHAYKLNLTVEDSGGSPIEYASVTVRQKQGYEFHQFITDANGEIQTSHNLNLDPIFVYREETATSTYDTWSDGTGNQVHVLEVYKDGYEPHAQEIAFDQDRTVTVVLQDEGADTTSTKLYDSTIYDSTIY